jgi:uncharacterized protein (DUF302 family)
MQDEFLILTSTGEPLESVCQRLPDIAQKHKFGVLGTHDLRQKMESKGVPFDRECRVFEVCNPQQAQAVLTRSIEISTALPCRIAVYQQDGRTVLATIRPTKLLAMFDAADAASIAQDVESTIVRIMEEAATPGA